MSTTIDDRVVSLEFDNQKFEKNVQISLRTLDELKKALDFSDLKSSVGNIEKSLEKVDFSNMEKGVDSLQDRFSALGIIGKRVLENLTDKAIQMGANLWNNSIGQITQGGKRRALNLEQARFQMMGILKDESMYGEKVEAVMTDVKGSVDQTAFSLDEAATVAAQLAASGIEASANGGQMLDVLKAVAGSAAMTGDDFATMGNIFTKVAGNGRMMGQELNQLSAHGLNAAATIRDYWNDVLNGTADASDEMIYTLSRISGGMEVTEADIREFTSKGKVSFEIFSNAMQHAFGDAATKANETFTGALSNVKSALSRIGAKFYEPYLQDMRDVFNALRPAINSINDALGDLKDESSIISHIVNLMHGARDIVVNFLNKFTELGVAKPIIQGIFNIFKALLSVLKPIGKAFSTVFSGLTGKGLSGIKAVAEVFAKFTEKLILSEKVAKVIEVIFTVLFKVLKAVGVVLGGVVWVLSHAVQLVGALFDYIRDGISRLVDVVKQSEIIQRVMNYITHMIQIFKVNQGGLNEKLDYLASLLRSQICRYLQKVYEYIKPIWEKIKSFPNYIRNFFSAFASKASEGIPKIVGGISTAMISLFDAVKKNGPKVASTFKGIFDGLINFIDNFDFGVFTRLVDGILGMITGILNSVANYVEPIGNALFDILIGAINVVSNRAPELIHAIVEMIKNILKAAIVEIANIIVSGGAKIVGWIKGFFTGANKETDKGAKGLATKFGSVTEVFTKFKDKLKSIGDKIIGFFKPLFEKIKALLGNSEILNLIRTGAFALIALKFNDLVKTFKYGTNFFSRNMNSLKTALYRLRDSLTETTRQITPGKILAVAAAIAILAGSIWLLSSVDPEGAARGLAMVSALLAELVGVMYAIVKMTTFSKGSQKRIDWKSFAAMFAGMMILGAAAVKLSQALVPLSKINPKNITAAFQTLTGLMIELAGGLWLMGKASKPSNGATMKDIIVTAIGILALAHGVKMLAQAMMIMNEINPEVMFDNVIVIGAFLGALALVINQTASNPNLKGAASLVTAFAFGILILAAAIKLLSMMEWDVFMNGIAKVAMGMLLLVGAVKAIGNQAVAGVAATVLALAIAINLLILPIYILGHMNWKTLLKGLASVAVLLVGLGIAMRVMGSVKKYSIGAAAAILALALALGILIRPVRAFGSMAAGGLIKGVSAVMNLMVMLTACVSVLTWVAANMTGDVAKKLIMISGVLIALALAVTLLTIPIKILGSMPLKQVMVGLFGMTMALLGLGAALGILGLFATEMAMGAAALAIFGIAVLALGLGLKYACGGLIQFAAVGIATITTISAMLVELAAGVGLAIIVLANDLGIAVGELLGALGRSIHEHKGEIRNLCIDLIDIAADAINQAGEKIIDVALNLIVKLIDALLERTPEIVDKLITWVIQIIDGITARVPELGDSIGNLISAIMGVFEAHGTEPPSMDSILEALLGITAVITVLQALPLTAGLEAGLQFVEFMGVFALMLAALAGLNQIPGFTEFMAGGLDLLYVLADGIGGFVGHFIGSMSSGITAELPKMAEDLSNFGDKIGGFVTAMKAIDDGVTTGVKNIAEAILILTATDLIDGILKWLGAGVDFSDMGEQLKSFAPYMVDFAAQMEGIGADVVESAANAALAIAEMFKLINDNDIFSAFESAPDMETFGNQLVEFGKCLKNYVAEIDGFEMTDSFNASVEGAEQLIALNKALNGSTSWMDDLFGSSDLETFGSQLVKFATALQTYKTNIEGFSMTESFKNSVDAALVLVDLNSALADSTTMWDQLFGHADLETFGTQLGMFGSGLATYCSNVSGIKDIDTASKAAGFAAKLITALGTVKTAGTVAGSKLPELGENLAGFAPGLKTFATSVAGMVFDTVEAAITAAATIIDALAGKEIPTGENLTLLGAQLQNFGPMIASFAKSVDGMNFTEATSAMSTAAKWAEFLQGLEGITIDSVQGFREAINAMKTVDMSGLEAAFSQSADSIKSTITSLFASLTKKFTDQYGKYRNFGKTMMQKFKEGILSQKSEVQSAVSTVINGATGGTNGIYNAFKTIGANGVDGFIDGLQSKPRTVDMAGAKIAQWALDAARRELDVESPSKEMYKIGAYATEGFVLGLGGDVKSVTDAGKEVAEFALDAIATTMALAEDNGDFTPTITPVLDLTNVQNGISSMNSMMTGRSYSLAASTGMIMTPGSNLLSGINARNAASGNGDILKSLGALRAEVASLHGDVANMKVVMDSGALVGSIAPRMDAQLGKMAVYKGRGN